MPGIGGSPPPKGKPDSFDPAAVMDAGRLQASFLNRSAGREVDGGRLIAATLARETTEIRDLGFL